MNATWKADALALGMIAAMFLLAAVTWSAAPEQIPVHWNWAGQPDRFGGRFEGLLGLPLSPCPVVEAAGERRAEAFLASTRAERTTKHSRLPTPSSARRLLASCSASTPSFCCGFGASVCT